MMTSSVTSFITFFRQKYVFWAEISQKIIIIDIVVKAVTFYNEVRVILRNWELRTLNGCCML